MSRPVFVRLGSRDVNLSLVRSIRWEQTGGAELCFSDGSCLPIGPHSADDLRQILEGQSATVLPAPFVLLVPCVPPTPTPDPEEWGENDRIGLGLRPEPDDDDLAEAAAYAAIDDALTRPEVPHVGPVS